MIQIDNIKLSLANETELRTVKMFSNGIFKGLQVPGAAGLDVNNLFNSMVKDYALYSVDDLFFGKVSIVGIYKSTTKLADIKNNFEFFKNLVKIQLIVKRNRKLMKP